METDHEREELYSFLNSNGKVSHEGMWVIWIKVEGQLSPESINRLFSTNSRHP